MVMKQLKKNIYTKIHIKWRLLWAYSKVLLSEIKK